MAKHEFEIRGNVVDPEGIPYGAMSLKFEREGVAAETYSDQDGNFKIRLPVGKYRVTTNEANSKTFTAFIEITERGPNPTNFDLVVELNKNWCSNCIPGKMPEARSVPLPAYPIQALPLKASGEVIVDIEFDSSGNMMQANMVSGNVVFKSAVEKCAMSWKFSPDESLPVRKAQLVFAFHPDHATVIKKRWRSLNRLEIPFPALSVDTFGK